MPLFCFYCLDNETDGATLRANTRPAHVEWLKSLGDALRMAGPLRSEEGGMIGSVLLVRAEDLTAAQAISASDPYAKAGVFSRVDVRESAWLFGEGKPE